MSSFSIWGSLEIHGGDFDVLISGTYDYQPPEQMTLEYPGCDEDITLYIEEFDFKYGGLVLTEGKTFDKNFDMLVDDEMFKEQVLDEIVADAELSGFYETSYFKTRK